MSVRYRSAVNNIGNHHLRALACQRVGIVNAPMPLAPPVTIAVRPVSLPIVVTPSKCTSGASTRTCVGKSREIKKT